MSWVQGLMVKGKADIWALQRCCRVTCTLLVCWCSLTTRTVSLFDHILQKRCCIQKSIDAACMSGYSVHYDLSGAETWTQLRVQCMWETWHASEQVMFEISWYDTTTHWPITSPKNSVPIPQTSKLVWKSFSLSLRSSFAGANKTKLSLLKLHLKS